MSRPSAVLTRVFGVGLASALAAVTVALALTGRIGLYINPESAWFAVGMSVLGLVGAIASFALPLGAEADHGHDHGDAPAASAAGTFGAPASPAAGFGAPASRAAGFGAPASRRGVQFTPQGDASAPNPTPARTHTHTHTRTHEHERERKHTRARAPHEATRARPRLQLALGAVAASAGGVLATGVVGLALVTPPATLSAELAVSRDTGAPPLFQGADTVALATTGDTASFGVGEWASVFATATNPEAFEGDEISLTGFVTPADGGGFGLTRLVITHCVIDAQPASIPVGTTTDAAFETGDWVTVTGVIRDRDGTLVVEATGVQGVAEPEDPYEY